MQENKPPIDSVLFIHEVNYRTKPIFEMHEFPEILSSKGVRVAFLHFEEGAKFWTGWKRKSSELMQGRVVKSANIKIITPFQLGIPALDRLVALISMPWALARELRTEPPSAVVSYAFPTGGIAAILLCRYFGIPHLQRVIDFSPGLRRFPFSIILRMTDWLIFRLGRDFSTHNEYLAERITIAANSLTTRVFLNLPPIQSVSVTQKRAIEKNLEFEKKVKGRKLNIVFLGTLYAFSGITEVVKKLFSSDSLSTGEVFLHIFGAGQEEEKLRNLIEANKMKEVAEFYGFLDFEKISYVFSKCDIGIVPFRNTKIGNYSLPNKALQYIASGLPVISTPLKGLSTVVDSSAMFTIQSIDDLPDLLTDLLIDENRLKAAKAATRVIARKFDYETTSASLIKTIEQVVKRG